MLFIPNYAVSYKGQFYRSGEQFEIAEADAAEMSRHGTVLEPPEVSEPPEMPVPEEQEPPSKRGRGRRGAEQ